MPEWKIEVEDSVVLGDLIGALEDPDPDPDPRRAYLRKALVGQFQGFSVHIFSNEHPPPHFRVRYAGETADFTIEDCQHIAGGLKRYHRKIRAWHGRNKDRLKDAWNLRRPTDCPAGPIAQGDA